MANKRLNLAALAALGLVLVALAGWQWSRFRQARQLGQANSQAPQAALPAIATQDFEAAVRASMPALGLLRPDWLRKDADGWNLKIPRRRDAHALGEALRTSLEAQGFKPLALEWRDYPQWRGFSLKAGTETLTAVQDRNPGLAFVIDDWGYPKAKMLEAMKNFPGRLTIAVMPGLPDSAKCAEAAFAVGHEVILHLPMEPEAKMPMLEGTLLVGMPTGDVLSWLDRHAATVPHMSGLNNHEGSKGSADTALMRAVCGWLKPKGEYFLDSKTSAKSVGEAEARLAGIPYAARRVFLDNVDSPAAIEKAARQALAIAKKTGSCIAIGHPRENTLAVLSRLAPEFIAQDVDLVRASELTLFEIQPHGR